MQKSNGIAFVLIQQNYFVLILSYIFILPIFLFKKKKMQNKERSTSLKRWKRKMFPTYFVVYGFYIFIYFGFKKTN